MDFATLTMDIDGLRRLRRRSIKEVRRRSAYAAPHNVPIDVESLILDLGFDVRRQAGLDLAFVTAEAAHLGLPLVDENEACRLSGYIIASPASAVIFLDGDEDVWDARTRFTAGHELGHYFNDVWGADRSMFALGCSQADQMKTFAVSYSMSGHVARWRSWAAEVLANEFSAELLMPIEHLSRHFPLTRKPVSFETINEVASTYEVSFPAAVLRYVTMSDEAVAFVQTEGGRVTRFWRSEPFKQQIGGWITKGAPISPRSITASLCDDTERWEASGRIQVRDWFSGTNRETDALWEICIRRGGKVLTLLWDQEGPEQ